MESGIFCLVKTHPEIDDRSFVLAQAIVEIIDRDPLHAGLQKARMTCQHWSLASPSPAVSEWAAILEQDWPKVRMILLDPGEEGRRLRQNSPFCGILSPQERWAIFKRFSHESTAA